MSDVSFNLQPVSEKPSRKYRKGSKYDPLLDAFMSGPNNLVAVNTWREKTPTTSGPS